MGQKAFGPEKCGVCGMFYEPKHGEDVDKHAHFHQQFLDKFKVPSLKGSSSLTVALGQSSSLQAAEDAKGRVPKSPLVRSLDLKPARLTEAAYRAWSTHLLNDVFDFPTGKVRLKVPSDCLYRRIKFESSGI